MTAKSFFVKQEKLVFPVEIKCAFLKKKLVKSCWGLGL